MRTRLWLASVILALAFYGLRSTQLPRRSAVGVEHRLFAGVGYTPVPEPGGKAWLVGVPTPQPLPGNLFKAFLQRGAWPGGYHEARRLTPFREGGTWLLLPLGVRRVWSHPASTVWQDRYLWEGNPVATALWDEPLPPAFDYRARRPLLGPEAERLLQNQPQVADPWNDADETYTEGWSELSAEAAGIEGLTGELYYSLRATSAGRALRLWWGREDQPARALYAISDEATPKVLRLTANAEPKALSADGRTLFFERDGALWRLDLRRPLPELLDEAAPPALPESAP